MRHFTLKPINNHFAFTLIEVVVALTIFSIVAVGLGTSFLSGIKLWDKANESFSAGEVQFFLEVFARDLCQSINLAQVGFSGTKEAVSFPALVSGRAVKVTYSFERDGKKIFRRTANLKDALSGDNAAKYDKEESLQLDSCELSYFYYDTEKEEYSWTDAWDKKNGIFLGVRINAAYEGNEFTKTVFIPVS